MKYFAIASLLAFSLPALPPVSPPGSQNSAQPPPHYEILAISPSNFPVLPLWPSGQPRDLHQAGIVVRTAAGTQIPAYLRFRDRNGLDLEVPVSGAVQVGVDAWSLTTPHAVVPNLLPGRCAISAGNHSIHLESLAVGAAFP